MRLLAFICLSFLTIIFLWIAYMCKRKFLTLLWLSALYEIEHWTFSYISKLLDRQGILGGLRCNFSKMFESSYKSQYIGGQKEKFVRYRIQKSTIILLFHLCLNVKCSIWCQSSKHWINENFTKAQLFYCYICVWM